MYCSVVFAAIERNILKWFEVFFEGFLGGVFFVYGFFNLKFCCSLIGWPFVPQDFYPYLQIFSDPSLNFLVFVCCLSFVLFYLGFWGFFFSFFKEIVPFFFNCLHVNLTLRRNLTLLRQMSCCLLQNNLSNYQ